jgi:hypothetical protein
VLRARRTEAKTELEIFGDCRKVKHRFFARFQRAKMPRKKSSKKGYLCAPINGTFE